MFIVYLYLNFLCSCFVVVQRKTTTLMYKNIICFFSFPFITRNVRMSRVKERVEDGSVFIHTGTEVLIYDETSPAISSSFSTFRRLANGHLKFRNSRQSDAKPEPKRCGI